MLEVLSTIGLTASAAIVIGCLAYAMAETPRGRLTVAGVLTAWFALVVTIGASAALVSAFFAFGPIRAAMLAAPLPALVAVNAIRILPGWLFVLLYAVGELPAPFAPSAGWGDIFASAAALPIAWLLIRFGRRVAPLVFVWSVIGIADLVTAIALGALSAPGALQALAGPPTPAIMTSLPWLIVPGFLVPSLIFIHVVIFYRLAGAGAWGGAAPAGGARPRE